MEPSKSQLAVIGRKLYNIYIGCSGMIEKMKMSRMIAKCGGGMASCKVVFRVRMPTAGFARSDKTESIHFTD